MQEQKMILKIDNDGRVDMKLYTFQDADVWGSGRVCLSICKDGKDIAILFSKQQAELFARRLQVLKNTLI